MADPGEVYEWRAVALYWYDLTGGGDRPRDRGIARRIRSCGKSHRRRRFVCVEAADGGTNVQTSKGSKPAFLTFGCLDFLEAVSRAWHRLQSLTTRKSCANHSWRRCPARITR